MLPRYCGLVSPADAQNPGLGVHEVVDRLKRLHFSLQQLWQVFLTRLTAEPLYELKMLFSHHAYLCAEQVTQVRNRVAEMRHPPLGLDKVPHPALAAVFVEIRQSSHAAELCAGLYQVVLPAIISAGERHLQETNGLADAPTVRVLQQLLLDAKSMQTVGAQAAETLREQAPEGLDTWLELLQTLLQASGGLDGTAEPLALAEMPARYANQPWAYDKTPQRDERFPDPYNMGVHAEAFLYTPEFPAQAKTLLMYYKRLREIDVPEMMASILVETGDKPWDFYRDLTRQLWDEARHAMMGEVGYESLGIDWAKFVMVNFTWSKGLNEQLTARERHAVLWFIEQGLMNKIGKRYEWEVGTESGDPLAKLFQDYDWADEVLHARIGRDWYVKDFEDVEKAAEYGSECWSKVVSDWADWQRQGLTEHRNWWPDLYREFCRLHGVEPEEKLLAFDTTYASTRADLQRIAQSG